MAGTVTNYNGSTQIWNLNNNLVDTSSLVSLEIQVLETKKSPLTTKQTSLNNEKTAYSGFKNSFNSFVTFMKDMSSFKGDNKATSVSQSGFVTATATTDAISGTYNVGVKQLATRQQIGGNTISDLSQSILAAGSTATITINGKDVSITDGMTYQQLINQVNADSSYGATMYTVGGRLFMASTQTGADGAIKLTGDQTVLSSKLGLESTVSSVTKGNLIANPGAKILTSGQTATVQINGTSVNITDKTTYRDFIDTVNQTVSGVEMFIGSDGTLAATGINTLTDDGTTPVLVPKLGFPTSGFNNDSVNKFNNEITKAQDAEYYINDAGRTNMLTSSSNTIDSAIPGLTLNLEKVTGPVLDPSAQPYPDPTLDVTVTVEGSATDPYINKVKAMVDSFNAAVDTLANYTAEGTYMQAGSIALATSKAMGDMVMFKSTAGQYLSQYGIQVDKTGHLSVDDTKIRDAFKNDVDTAKAFFFGTDGIASTMNTALDKIFGETGSLTTQLTSIDDQLSDISKKLADIDAANKVKQEAIVEKYALFEQQMSALNSQLSYIQAVTKSKSSDN